MAPHAVFTVVLLTVDEEDVEEDRTGVGVKDVDGVAVLM